MDLNEFKQRLEKLDAQKLMDIVKNHKQYGYPEELRNYAIELLKHQGISLEDLRLTGNLENTRHSRADDLFRTFQRNSSIAFLAYCLLVILKGLSVYRFINEGGFLPIFLAVLLVTYLVFLLRSFLNHSDFYKMTGSDFGSEIIFTYLFLGMPFYIVMYFVFRNQMKERMTHIR